MPMLFIMSKNMEHSSEKMPRELKERFTNFTHLLFLVISLIKFSYFSFLRTALLLRLDSKPTVNSRTYRTCINSNSNNSNNNNNNNNNILLQQAFLHKFFQQNIENKSTFITLQTRTETLATQAKIVTMQRQKSRKVNYQPHSQDFLFFLGMRIGGVPLHNPFLKVAKDKFNNEF